MSNNLDLIYEIQNHANTINKNLGKLIIAHDELQVKYTQACDARNQMADERDRIRDQYAAKALKVDALEKQLRRMKEILYAIRGTNICWCQNRSPSPLNNWESGWHVHTNTCQWIRDTLGEGDQT